MATKRYHPAVLVSCEIPWDDGENLMEDVFRQEIRATLDQFDNLYIFGTAGEGYAVTVPVFRDIVAIFREETDRGGVHPMVGCIGMSTSQVVERVGIAWDAGFRVFQVSLPPWGALNDAELLTWFTDVCGAFPEARFVHYNLPRPKRVLYAADYRRLQDAVGNLVGTKSTGLGIGETLELARDTELMHFYGEANFPLGCRHGECGLLASYGAMFPARTKELFELGRQGRFDELARLHAEFLAVADRFWEPTKAFGELIDGAYDKMIVRASGIDMPLRLLSPYQSFPLEVFEACVAGLRAHHPDWLA